MGRSAGEHGRCSSLMKPDISIIVPVLNERETIHRTLKNLYLQKFDGIFEVIVVDGSEDGSTICCVENPSVITAISSPGRGIQMNCGARMAGGKILLFLHSDTILPHQGLNDILCLMKDPSIKAGAFDLSINNEGFAYRVIEKTASLRSRITRLPYGDQAVFIRQAYFFGIGCFRGIPIMEDVELMRRIKKANGKIGLLNSCTTTSPRRWETEGFVFCTLRNWIILILFFWGVKPEKLARVYKPQI